jgi:hypothetical protein
MEIASISLLILTILEMIFRIPQIHNGNLNLFDKTGRLKLGLDQAFYLAYFLWSFEPSHHTTMFRNEKTKIWF